MRILVVETTNGISERHTIVSTTFMDYSLNLDFICSKLVFEYNILNFKLVTKYFVI